MPLKAAYEMSTGWAQLRRDLPKVTIPVLSFRSAVDHVATSRRRRPSTRALVQGLRGAGAEDSYHVATLDNDAPRIFAESAAFIERVTSEQQG